jgi:OOP family OmpA-OmpF porin
MRTPRALALLLAVGLLAGCSRNHPPGPRTVEERPADVLPVEPAREVFRLEPDDRDGLRVSGVVATAESRSLLLAEVGRRWPGRRVRGDLTVESGVPAFWVPEAMALLPFAASIENGGLTVLAEGGVSGGGVLSITGRVPDDAALARLAADAEASVAPPFVIETAVDVGLAADSSSSAEAVAAPVLVLADPEAEPVAAGVREALGQSAITFQPGTAHLDQRALDLIQTLAAALAGDAAVVLAVSAYGEGTGSTSLDRALAARRAGAIVDRLRMLGLESGRVAVADDPSTGPFVTIRLSGAASN